MFISRNSHNFINNWWWTVDKTLLSLISGLIALGILMSFTASPSVALTNNYDNYHFVIRQCMFAPLAFCVMIFLSMQNVKFITRFACILFLLSLILTAVTLIFEDPSKGASRWIKIMGFSLQPSEFIKPTFAVVVAWLFDSQRQYSEIPGKLISFCFLILTIGLLISQPDIGMSLVIFAIWCFQLFLNGLAYIWVFTIIIGAVIGLVIVYLTYPHFYIRVQQFIASNSEVSYQIKKAMAAFHSGHFFGRGPGEGVAKINIPDAHTDFVFAVAAEEFGFIICSIIIGVYAIIVIRSMKIALKDNNYFIILSSAGLAASFGLQCIVNIASSLHLIPTKGMTLPFMSYGGSSMLATSIVVGLILAFNRRKSLEDE